MAAALALALEALRREFQRGTAACAVGAAPDPAARQEAACSLTRALERVHAELAVVDTLARTDLSTMSPERVAADVARLEADLRRKSEVLAEHSARSRDWQLRLDAIATECRAELRTDAG